MNDACIIVGVALDSVVKVETRQVQVKRFNERTGEPYQKSIKELLVQIAGKTVYQDEYELLLDECGNIDSWVDSQVQEVIGKFGNVQVFREYGILGIDVVYLNGGEEADGVVKVPVKLTQIIGAVSRLEMTLEKAWGVIPGSASGPKVDIFLCGSCGGDLDDENFEQAQIAPF